MNAIQNRPKNDIAVYLCGGTGADIASVLVKDMASLSAQDQANLGNLTPYMIDTSISNLNATHTGIPFQHLKKDGVEMDGGGKMMMEVFDAAKAAGRDIVKAMPPGRFSIVVGNLGGGSGSGITVALTRELVSQGHDVIVVGIAASESKAVLDNTNRSIALLKSVSSKFERTVVLAPFFAGGAETFAGVNNMIVQHVLMLGCLLSNQNARLDTADLKNWLNVDKALSVEPDLVGLFYTHGHNGLDMLVKGVVPLTVATLTGSQDQSAAPGWDVEYQAHGILPQAEGSSIFDTLPAHFSVCDGVVQAVHIKIMEQSQAIARALANRPKRQALSMDGINLHGMDV